MSKIYWVLSMYNILNRIISQLFIFIDLTKRSFVTVDEARKCDLRDLVKIERRS